MAPRRRKPTFTPTQLAILTGSPLPPDYSWFEAQHACDPDAGYERGYATWLKWTIRDLWRQFHKREMTAEEAAALRRRGRQIARESLKRRKESAR